VVVVVEDEGLEPKRLETNGRMKGKEIYVVDMKKSEKLGAAGKRSCVCTDHIFSIPTSSPIIIVIVVVVVVVVVVAKV